MSKNTNVKQNKLSTRKTVDLLPSYFRTEKNSKFLSSTLDQLISVPQVERIDGYIGSKITKNYNAVTDQYINTGDSLRDRYQLEPGLVVKDDKNTVKKVFGYDDLINQLAINGGTVDNLDNLFRPEFYSYNPPIDWDKFINFGEYFWLSSGPLSVLISGTAKTSSSTYTVTDSVDGNSFVFTPDGLTPNPVLTLYRGETYTFIVKTLSKLYIKSSNTFSSSDLYETGITGNGTETITFIVPSNAPKTLYYSSDTNNFANGNIVIKQKSATTKLNVDKEIVGKRSYISGSGSLAIELSNGLKIRFTDDVLPVSYRNREYYVEGVGSSIVLTDVSDLQTPETILADKVTSPFDGTNFDKFPFDAYKNIPIVPEYITINRSSRDRNSWSRYNRWFHSTVIETSMRANGLVPTLDSTLRASRPIIEFIPNLQLYNFGSEFLGNVSLIDTTTTDVFSTIENYPISYSIDPETQRTYLSSSYAVDGILLNEGHRVVFNADLDPLVLGKVFDVSIIINPLDNTKGNINLTLSDAQPFDGSSILVALGAINSATQWGYHNSSWIKSQDRVSRNQAPLFDLFDNTLVSYNNAANATFTGNKLFGYKIGAGANDPVLGFPISYGTNIKTSGTYQFQNYFATESFYTIQSGVSTVISTDKTYFRINESYVNKKYSNVWVTANSYQIPILQINEITDQNSVEITAIKNAGLVTDMQVSVLLNDTPLTEYAVTTVAAKKFVNFTTSTGILVLKIISDSPPTQDGFYESPLNLTNNPYNTSIPTFTFSELSDHVNGMVSRDPEFSGVFPGVSNLRQLPGISTYGSRLVINATPLTYAQHFITDIQHDLINATRLASDNYNTFKIALINAIADASYVSTAASTLDEILISLNQNKNSRFPYANSDMLAYGTNNVTRNYPVTDSHNQYYFISSPFDITKNSFNSVLVYVNDIQLTHGIDYDFDANNSYIKIKSSLTRGDNITINEYSDTSHCYIAPTPTKLGLYPKFVPSKYLDSTYAYDPVEVIQGHDGSIIRSYGDYRDDIILEFEKRIFNNIKTNFNDSLIDLTTIKTGAFRKNKFDTSVINDMMQNDFLKWANFYGIDFESNLTYDLYNHKTYNYSSSPTSSGTILPGNWRAIYKWYFDTDRPNTCPWEMLGFSIKPEWWDSKYGSSPYTAGNKILWNDLEVGNIAAGPTAGIDSRYARPGLSALIPVDDSGNLIDVREWNPINQVDYIYGSDNDWVFGNQGPAETAWRRSSNWPFTVQILLALCNPARYAALLADVGNITTNKAGQYIYSTTGNLINVRDLATTIATSTTNIAGYIYYVLEAGKLRTPEYATLLAQDLANSNFNLINKVGGFVSKDKLRIIIDSISPTTINPGVLLPQEDFSVYLKNSGNTKTISISGVIIKKSGDHFVISGYDRKNPYFTIFQPIHQRADAYLTVGGKSKEYLTWAAGQFYQAGQIVLYSNSFYNVLISNSSDTFNSKNFNMLVTLPMVGGVTVQTARRFNNDEIKIHYGTKFSTIQEVYDTIIGYGQWLVLQGFIFDEYNTDLEQVINWNFTASEFLYWSTQNWSDGSAISMSPIADSMKFSMADYFVDNFIDPLYEYSLLKVDGTSLKIENFSVLRDEGFCKLSTINSTDGLFFARLNLVQKEHIIVLNNYSIFNDIIYDIQSGYRQQRIKIVGFKTSDWNGDYFSPGFIYDPAIIVDWTPYTDYIAGDIVKYSGNYYSAIKNSAGTLKFDFSTWSFLPSKPEPNLLPNFDYKISQFQDFYSLDIDNIDVGQQKMAQHLIGYTPRSYLDNIFVNPIAQYKFYQGYIREKGTRNAIEKLSKASMHNLQGKLEINEEWAFRAGIYGGYSSSKELEFSLKDSEFLENPQIVVFADTSSSTSDSNYSVVTPTDFDIKPFSYNSQVIFETYSGTSDDNNLVLPIAGYVRTDDVTATAVNTSNILDIANTYNIKEGNTVWTGFADNGDWSVQRYTMLTPKIESVYINLPGVDLIIKTNNTHDLSVGDIVSITRVSSEVNGVYKVASIPSLDTFTVPTTLTTVSTDITVGLLFKFISTRFNKFDDLASFKYIADMKFDELVWVDNNLVNKWEVYKKTQNYAFNSTISLTDNTSTQQVGHSIVSSYSSDAILISAPTYYDASITDLSTGRIIVNSINAGEVSQKALFGIANNYYFNEVEPAQFGYAMAYNATNSIEIIVASAPYAGNIRCDSSGTTRFANNTNTVVASTASGLVEVFGIDRSYTPAKKVPFLALVSQQPQDNAQFGKSIFVSSQTTSTLMVGAPGQDNNTGKVFVYSMSVVNSTATVISTQVLTTSSVSSGSLFGTKISGAQDGSIVAITAPGYNSNVGAVFVYTKNLDGSYKLSQEIKATDIDANYQYAEFASDVLVSNGGAYLLISSPRATDGTSQPGKVFVYEIEYDKFVLKQTLNNPSNEPDLYFGNMMAISDDSSTIAITAYGSNKYSNITFDNGATTYDSNVTTFGAVTHGAGTVYTYNRKYNKFIFAEELYDSSVGENSKYGASIVIKSESILVGAPSNYSGGSVFNFSKLNNGITWQTYRSQEDLVDLSKVKRAVTINSVDDSIVDYVEIIDPAKGRIPGIADQELNFKTAFDPAIYSIGNSSVVTDLSITWMDEHVGQLWWDLSTVKYVWYEQGELAYRKNVWGNIFPGSSIDIYEWVRSEYLPSEWAVIADTNAGISLGMSGQPKYIDNSVVSVGQYYNALSGTFTNVYYYWVKNAVIVPTTMHRRISAYEVSNIITNPKSTGLEFIAFLSTNAISVTNIKPKLSGDLIKLNLSYDELANPINGHTEWILIEDGTKTSAPTAMLNKKLIDSLLGHDALGNLVPDLSLPEKMKYGIEIRPRQSMFKDRREALRNIITYANVQLATSIIVGFVDFTKLNMQDLIPDAFDGGYDVLLADETEINTVDYSKFSPAILLANLDNSGKIASVSISNPGIGYGKILQTSISPARWMGPSITISDNTDAKIITRIDINGSIVETEIINPGSAFVTVPDLIVRPFTVLVTMDSTSNNKWSEYINYNNTWIKVQIQKYNTKLYWDYIDWKSSTFNSLQSYYATVTELYGLSQISPADGQYVKVLNSGDGRFIILEKISSGMGSFNADYNIVYSEKGTIQIHDEVWNTINSTLGFDQSVPFDQTLFDQTPDIETENILHALKDDIFIQDRRDIWSKLFFASVKYAMMEQKTLDWAFKTSFINVKNIAGNLDQRPTYKFQNSSYFEDYLKEVKPYHTQIRNFSTNYQSLEPSQTYTTDFDLPSVYNKEMQTFESVTLNSEEINSYPHRGWLDNYKFMIDSIVIGYAGSGYNTIPTIEIVADSSDIITVKATAEAYVSSGKLSEIIVTNPGYGYTKPPKVIITGGGNAMVDAARVYAILKNNTVRKNIIGMKFDRISNTRNIFNNKKVVDNFITDGFVNTFELSWAAQPTGDTTEVYANGIKLLLEQYKLVNYTSKYIDPNQDGLGYTKHYSKLIIADGVISKNTTTINADVSESVSPNSTLIYLTTSTNIRVGQSVSFQQTSVGITTVTNVSFANPAALYITVSPPTSNAITSGTRLKFIDPNNATSVMIQYDKSIELYNATDRILDYYTPTSGMPGFDSSQLMHGITYPGVELQTLPFNYSANLDQLPFDSVFWEDSDNNARLDTIIDGGGLASGVNPENVVVDGDAFLSANSSYAPEEMVPGQIKESLSVSVYTTVNAGSSVIFTSSYPVASVNVSTIVKLPAQPVSFGSILVSYNDVVMVRDIDYTVDLAKKELTLSPQLSIGTLSITIIGVSGGKYLSTDSTSVTNSTSTSVVSSALFSDIKSAYVTVNGQKISTSISESPYYVIAPVSSRNKRGAAKVYGMSTGTNTVTAWFFGSPIDAFSEIHEQNLNYDGRTSNFIMEHPPKNLWSQSSQAIVEMNNRRLTPPNTTYYTVSDSSRVFDIDPNNNYPAGTFDYSILEVHVNGIKIRDIIDYRLNDAFDQIVFNTGFLNVNDELAITILKDCDYYIVDDVFYILPSAGGGNLRIVTFSNQDRMQIEQEVFDAHLNGLYKIARQVFNDNYIWISINGKPLTSKVDYYVFADGKTIKINDNVTYPSTCQVVITTINNIKNDITIGYRIFKDMLDRTHFKRISAINSTYLTQPLIISSTSISVFNAGVLPDPSPATRIPGIVFIDGERIEYMEKNGNILSRITRATLGTGARSEYPIGTTVVDQGAEQTIPFSESRKLQQFTATNTTTYFITTATISLAPGVDAHDQVSVYYGGQLLQKPTPLGVTRVSHNPMISFDSGENSSDTVLPSEFNLSFDGTLTINVPILVGTLITVVKNQSSLWYEPGNGLPANGDSLLLANTLQAQFLRERTATIPDKYYYAQQ